MSVGWWTESHTRHHNNPNQVGVDPNIDIGLVAMTEEQLSRMAGLTRALARYQAFLIGPVLSLEAFVMHAESIQFLRTSRDRLVRIERVLIPVHLALYVGGLVALLGPWMAIAFIAVHKLVEGFYLGAVFAPNHKGMPILERGRRIDFLPRQLLTTRDLYPSWATDYLWGGQNYQIEHHLFPSLPRHHMYRARQIVRAYCQQHGLPYHETSVVQSAREIVRYLHAISAPLRRPVQQSETAR